MNICTREINMNIYWMSKINNSIINMYHIKYSIFSVIIPFLNEKY